MQTTNKTKLIAIYFPQFHDIPENDKWWGRGFTDWQLVKEAKPLYKDHHQPRVPIDDDYYNPCNVATLAKQIEMAKAYGIAGFMFYHYWFDGKLILQKPLEQFLANPQLDMPFCLSWANPSWTRQWKGNNEILQKQQHLPDKALWRQHFDYLLPFFKDSRALKMDGKPMFVIYVPEIVNQAGEMFACWNQWAKENGLPGIYFVATKGYDFANPSFLDSYQAMLKFQPREANTSAKNSTKSGVYKWASLFRKLPQSWQTKLVEWRIKFKGVTFHSTPNVWQIILQHAYQNDYPQYPLQIFESAFFEWDNTARYGKRANIFTETTADQKRAFFEALYQKSVASNAPYLFFNAWNEWSESAYLEPDKKNGFTHLEIIKNTVQ